MDNFAHKDLGGLLAPDLRTADDATERIEE